MSTKIRQSLFMGQLLCCYGGDQGAEDGLHPAACIVPSTVQDHRQPATSGYKARPPANTGPQLVIDTGGHKAQIRNVLFTPDGRRLFSVSDDKTIRVWDVASGKLLRTLRGQVGQGHEGKLFAGALSPDGKWLAVGGMIGTGTEYQDAIRLIALQGPANARVRLLKGHTNVIHALAFSPDGRRLLSGGGDNTARLWEVGSGPGDNRPIAVLRGHAGPIRAVAFSLDGKRLVTGSDDHTLRLWAPPGRGRTGARPVAELTGHTDDVSAAAFTPDGRYLLSGSWDRTLRLWDGWDGRFLKCYGSRYFGGSVPHTGRGNRGTSRQPDSAHGQRI
ncbi:MAG: WD domain-containing protein, G-beta repeat-containing protein, partial [Candidatus Kentron sp. G]